VASKRERTDHQLQEQTHVPQDEFEFRQSHWLQSGSYHPGDN
jgi:hypothetical protein